MLSHKDILTFDEITDFARVAVSNGINKIRITGGEPLVRRDITKLVGMIASIQGVTDLSLTTNGILLEKYAVELKEAGLNRVNISLDTIDPERFRQITRVGNIDDVFRGIEAARGAGIHPIKINCVIKNSTDEPDAAAVADYCHKNGLEVRFIEQMNLSSGSFSIVHGGDGGNCAVCNRLRLTANGKLRPCLFSDIEIDIRQTGYEEAMRQALALKPACGTVSETGKFYNIGG